MRALPRLLAALGLSFPAVALAAAALPAEAAPQAQEAAQTRPGLLARYRSLADGATIERVEAKPAFRIGGSSPHPRLPPGPFEASWRGHLDLVEEEAVSLGAFVGGEVTVTVGAALALRGHGESEGAWAAGEALELGPGLHPITVEYRSAAGVPARLQLWWEGRTFSREPLPAWRLVHLQGEIPPSLVEEEKRERGRLLAGQLGCARCHAGSFPGDNDPPPGPALAGFGDSLSRSWLLRWLEDPAGALPGARMPALFPGGRRGFVERWIVTEHLLFNEHLVRAAGRQPPSPPEPPGDHRAGRREFIRLGCAACHLLPDLPPGSDLPPGEHEQRDPPRTEGHRALRGLGERMSAGGLARFLEHPLERYPDGRMPRFGLSRAVARNISAYLLLWSPVGAEPREVEPPSGAEIAEAARRLGVEGAEAAGRALVLEKGCGRCHPGLPPPEPADVPADVPLASPANAAGERGCLSGRTLPRFTLDPAAREDLEAHAAMARGERHPSTLEAGRRLLRRHGCFRCHARDAERISPLEEAAGALGGSYLETIPFQRTPRLTHAHLKYLRSYLLSAIRDGVAGVRPARYSYRMPAFGEAAEALALALAETDGDVPAEPAAVTGGPADPTLSGLGPRLAGFEGYSCVSCHAWNGQLMAEPDPGAIAPELTTVTGRVRRDWFDRWLEDPARIHPGTPMPRIFPRGEPATLRAVLDGDPGRQRDALWAYLALGKAAPGPRPLPPIPLAAPAGGGPLAAQVPLHLPDGSVVEALAVLFAGGDLFLYDVGRLAPRGFYTGARILRSARGRLRLYTLAGSAHQLPLEAPAAEAASFAGYDRLPDGVRVRLRAGPRGELAMSEVYRLSTTGGRRRLLLERAPGERFSGAAASLDLPPAEAPPAMEPAALSEPAGLEGPLERPGYRAVAYPRPRTASNEDLLMPGAVAVDPRDGRVFIASMKLGEIFVLRDPRGDGRAAWFEDYTGGLFQEAYSMLAEGGALHVLHRRNLTRITDTDGDGLADRFDRVAGLPHGVADTYDYGYGLARDRTDAFVLSYAPYADRRLAGAGAALRVFPGETPRQEELAFGFRNPIGWCADAEGEVFATDNQGEWVAANKLVHVVQGRFYGFPNPEQKEHAARPRGKAAVWVPYGWARSLNGVAIDSTGGKFGPFHGQFFLAELMFGGAIIRASLERVNGEYQGACFPFWGRGLLGPLALAFEPVRGDRGGRLFVGSITEPGWMAQPDRGGLFRIDYTGPTPFEIHSIRALPRGFRLIFTAPCATAGARERGSYSIEHYRYEYTGAYGSPELDRTPLEVEGVELQPGGLSADLLTAPLVQDRVYRISAPGVLSAAGEKLVHPTGVYTLNEIPARAP